MARVDEVADGVFRIGSFLPRANFTMNQFLIRAEDPLLFHTGPRSLFIETVSAIARVLDPATLRWIAWSHLESDECGAANEFLRQAPHAQLVTGRVGTMLGVADFLARPVHSMNDGEVLDLGGHQLRFLITPHVPHSPDATLALEQTTGTLLASDLFTQVGKPSPTTGTDVVGPALEAIRTYPELLPVGADTTQTLRRIQTLTPTGIAAMHGTTYTGNATQAIGELRAALAAFSGRTAEPGPRFAERSQPW